MYRVVIGVLLFWSSFCFAQRQTKSEIDSVYRLLKTDIPDTTRIHSLARLSRAFNGFDSIKTFQSANDAIKLARDIEYEKGIAHAEMALGNAYLHYYDFENTELHLSEATKIAERLVKEESSKLILDILQNSKYNLAVSAMIQGKAQLGVELTKEVIPIAEQLKDSLTLGVIHQNLGTYHLNSEQQSLAIEYYQKALAFYNPKEHLDEVIATNNSLSLIFYNLDSIDQMRHKLDVTEQLLRTYPQSPSTWSYYKNEALYNTKKGDYNKALEFLDKSKALVQESGQSRALALIYQSYAFVYEDMGNYQKAINSINTFIEMSKKYNSPVNVSKGLVRRSKFHEKTNNFQSAYNDYKRSIELRDSLEISKTTARVKDVELKYETEKKENEILQLQNSNTEKALALEKRKSQAYLYGIIIGILAVGLLFGSLWYRNKMKQQQKKERMHEQELLALKHEQEANVYAAMIEGQEKERKRLAIDLHDGLGGRLSGISLNLSKLDKDKPVNYPKRELQKVIKDLDKSLVELRGIARNMMPETLLKFGLEAALKDYCSSMKNHQTAISVQFYGKEDDIEISQKVTIYRVIQELINNAVKHAKASQILVQFMRENDQVDITVEDNGIGMSDEMIKVGADGMGLANLRTRVAFLKGNLEFNCEANEGTTVNINLNINAA
ncbi:sensor histidine kinase [Spongiivirga sp. MCCC 1A20706]|uniref:tetratricopeptide repeat-containing sensor histidine kinase n=1 Tax=Spongiivirga sp. MCCC 1A20706 TaxID=3160963 RepID=UPI00397740E8